ncbi:hypothetical protein CBS11852_10672 [Aspergillus niger]|nr:hypothetical protein CBS11852_10672 [Aspergillus niger]
MHPFQPLLSREKGFIRKRILNEWKDEWVKSPKGGHLRQIDKTLPAIRTRRLYGSLPRNRAYLLTQLRTGHTWLATYQKQHGFQDDDRFYNIERDVRDTRDVITPAHCCSASGLSYDSFTDFKIPAC